MKHICLLLLLSISCCTFTVSCEKKGPAEKVGDKIDDALNQRPHEKVKDAAENVKDAVKDATN